MTSVKVKAFGTGNKQKGKKRELFYFVIRHLELLINVLDLDKVFSKERELHV